MGLDVVLKIVELPALPWKTAKVKGKNLLWDVDFHTSWPTFLTVWTISLIKNSFFFFFLHWDNMGLGESSVPYQVHL